MASTTTPTATKEILTDIPQLIRVYTDGTVDRLHYSPYVAPSPDKPTTGVFSKDTTAPSARLYLPEPQNPTQKLPIFVYFHGGGFCAGSPFSLINHRYINTLSAESNALIISVAYRLAPEHPLPAAYEDCWSAFKWVCSHALDQPEFDKDPWISNHGDFSRIFIGGDSAGGNIAHDVAIRAGSEPLTRGNVKIVGAILSHPYFWSSDPIGFNGSKEENEQHICYKIWNCVYPNAAGGIDNPLINPFAVGAPCLSGVGCEKMLVCVSEKDPLAGMGIAYAEILKESGWKGEVEAVEVKGEDHCFQAFDPETENARNLIKRMASFINSS